MLPLFRLFCGWLAWAKLYEQSLAAGQHSSALVQHAAVDPVLASFAVRKVRLKADENL